MTILITRDNRNGGLYDAEKDKAENGRCLNEAPDIEVEIDVGHIHEGTNETDDPDSADIGDQGRVVKDIPKWDIVNNVSSGELLFRAGQMIVLTDSEIQEAHDQAINEARESVEPEYSYDD